MGCTKSNSKRGVYSNMVLPQKTRKKINRQPNFTPKTTEKEQKTQKLVKRRKS